MNSAIEGTDAQKELLEFQGNYCCKMKEKHIGRITATYFRKFLKQHETEINSTKTDAIEDKRDIGEHNMTKIYTVIYKNLTEAGYAEKLAVP